MLADLGRTREKGGCNRSRRVASFTDAVLQGGGHGERAFQHPDACYAVRMERGGLGSSGQEQVETQYTASDKWAMRPHADG